MKPPAAALARDNTPVTSRSKRKRYRPRGRAWPKGASGNPATQWRSGQSGNPRGRWQRGESGNERGRPLCPVVALRGQILRGEVCAVEALIALTNRRDMVGLKACITLLNLAFGPPGPQGWADDDG